MTEVQQKSADRMQLCKIMLTSACDVIMMSIIEREQNVLETYY